MTHKPVFFKSFAFRWDPELAVLNKQTPWGRLREKLTVSYLLYDMEESVLGTNCGF